MARPKSEALTPALPAEYAPLLAEIKQRVQAARFKATLAANAELLALYWDIGQLILGRQRREGWGAKVIDRLSADLQKEFPGQRGFSPRNLKYMRAFAEAWPQVPIVQAPLAQLPWYHHITLRDLSKPIGVSGYVTTLHAALPSVADLERELAGKRRRGGRP